MKKLFCLLYLTGAWLFNTFAAGSELVSLGLVSRLVEVKYHSEASLTRIIGDAATPKLIKDSAIANYNEIRVRIDRIIYQLSADMRGRNSVKTYKKLNKYYQTHDLGEAEGEKGRIKPYVLAFKELYLAYQKQVNPDQTRVTKGLITPAILLSIVNTGWTIAKNIRDMRGKKVDGIIELLNNLRLNAPQELAKGK